MNATNGYWTTDRQDQLERLLGEPLTASNIARRIGCTKNAIIGRVWRRRLKLPNTRPKTPVQSLDERLHYEDRVKPRGCVFVIGDPRKPDWRWCGKPLAAFGEPYCCDHKQMVEGGHG